MPSIGKCDGVSVGRCDGVSVGKFNRRLCLFWGGAIVWSDLLIQCTHPKHFSYLGAYKRREVGEGKGEGGRGDYVQRGRGGGTYLVACVDVHKLIYHSSAVVDVRVC